MTSTRTREQIDDELPDSPSERLLDSLAKILRSCGLARGVAPDEYVDLKDFRFRLAVGRDRTADIRDHCIKHNIGIENGHSRIARGSEFIDVMQKLARPQKRQRR